MKNGVIQTLQGIEKWSHKIVSLIMLYCVQLLFHHPYICNIYSCSYQKPGKNGNGT